MKKVTIVIILGRQYVCKSCLTKLDAFKKYIRSHLDIKWNDIINDALGYFEENDIKSLSRMFSEE